MKKNFILQMVQYIYFLLKVFLKKSLRKKIKIYEMKLSKSIDIDTLDDFNIVKKLMN